VSGRRGRRFRDRLRRQYAALASAYEERWADYLDDTLTLLEPALRGGAAGGTLVDVGCGTAALQRRLADWQAGTARYLGVDPSPEMLAEAATRAAPLPPAAFLRGGAEALPLAGGCADTLVMASVFQYLTLPERALAEAARVLRPGGRLLLVVWSTRTPRMRLRGLLLRLVGAIPRRPARPRALRALLRGAGLEGRRVAARRSTGGWEIELYEAVRAGTPA
jgi:SAM-dependent methyltransferase